MNRSGSVAFAVAILWLYPGSTARADEAGDRAAAFVQKHDGTVRRDDKAPGKPVVEVQLSFTKVTDAGLKDLAPLTGLTTLDLSDTKVTDGGVE